MWTIELEAIDVIEQDIQAKHSEVKFEQKDDTVNGNLNYKLSSQSLTAIYNYLLVYNGGDTEESLYLIAAEVKHISE